MIRCLVFILLTSCTSPENLVKKALKKDPQVLKQHVKAEVIYIKDTIYIKGIDGRVDTIIKNIPIEVPVVKIVREQSRNEKRINDKLAREALKQERAITDQMEARAKLAEDSIKWFRLEQKKLKQEVKLLKNENKELNGSFLKNWWWLILIISLAAGYFIKRLFS